MFRYRIALGYRALPYCEERFPNKIAAFSHAFQWLRDNRHYEDEVASVVVQRIPEELFFNL